MFERDHGSRLHPSNTRRAVLNNIRDFELAPPHPGELLREDVLPRLHLAPSGLAGKLGISIELLSDVLAERLPMTTEIAARLAATFGHSARFWTGLQMQYDRWYGGPGRTAV